MFSAVLTFLVSLMSATAALFASSGDIQLAQASPSVVPTSAVVLNAVPTVKTIAVSGHNGPPTSLFERTIVFSGFVDDQNGEGDIANVSFVAWRNGNGLGSACASDPNQCYRIDACARNPALGTDTEVWYSCAISIQQAYAYGTWRVRVNVTDLDAATGTLETDMPVVAFSFNTGTIGYRPPVEVVEPKIIGVPPFVPPTSPTEGMGGTLPVTPAASSTEQNVDCIAEFYNRIKKGTPSIRHNQRHTEACSDTLRVASRDSGLLVFDISDRASPGTETTRAATIEVPPGASLEWFTLHAERLSTENLSKKCTKLTSAIACSLINYTIVNDTLFHVYAEDHLGKTLNTLNAALRITLVVPDDLTKVPVRVYRLNAENTLWEEITPEDHDAHTVSFRTSQLGIFAILGAENSDVVNNAVSRLTLLLLIGTALLITLGSTLLVLLAIFKKRRVGLMQGPMRSSPNTHHAIAKSSNEPAAP